jgi:hypothetical protein
MFVLKLAMFAPIVVCDETSLQELPNYRIALFRRLPSGRKEKMISR